MAKTSDKTADWLMFSVKPETKVLLNECQQATPTDEYGRKAPKYAIITKALEMYLAKAKAEGGA